MPSHYKVADENCDCRELFSLSFCGLHTSPTHPIFAGYAIEHYFKFIFFNLDFILLEKLFSLLCKLVIMSLTLYKQNLCQVIISTRDL